MPAPIADYALLSDGHGSALVGRTGSIDWACLPRYDSPSTFGRLLDPDAGHWRLAPVADDAWGECRAERAYVPETMVMRTRWRTSGGVVTVTDAMPFLPRERGHEIGQRSPHAIVRIVEGEGGDVEMESEMAPRPEYGMTVPRWRLVDGGAVCRGGPNSSVLSSPVPVTVERGTARSRFTVRRGERYGFVVQIADPWGPAPSCWSTDRARAWVHSTIRGWQSWSAMHHGYTGPWAGAVRHSGRVLQALTHAHTGAVVAAPTTSLPEVRGGAENWDYRYVWVRDASLTVKALWVAACPDEIEHFFSFFMTAAGGRHAQNGHNGHNGHDGDDGAPLQILYGPGGERLVQEYELGHLAGYGGSRPVRTGNGAWHQRQLDAHGELLDAAAPFADRVGAFDPAITAFLVEQADRVAREWEQPDHGMWEIRGPARQYLHSKVMCWVTLDRALRLRSELGVGAERVWRWARVRQRIRQAVLEQGWSERAGAFTQTLDDDDQLDAAALLIPIVGFLPATDPRVLATIDAVHRRLGDGGLLRRFESDGPLADEGCFVVCSYWLAQARALAGDVDEAAATFERVSSFANDVGLLSEEIDPATGAMLGNFPQAFSHVGLVNAADAIATAIATASAGPVPATTGGDRR